MSATCAHCHQAAIAGSPLIEVTYPAHFRAVAIQRYTTVFLCSLTCLTAWAVAQARA
jgi:hypothetical protein